MDRIHHSFVDIHERNAFASDWEEQYVRTSVAPYRGELAGVVAAGVLVVRNAEEGALMYKGAAAGLGCHLLHCEGTNLRLNGSDCGSGEPILIGPGTPIDGACRSDFKAVRLSLYGDLARRLGVELQGVDSMVAATSRPGLSRLRASQADGARLRWLMDVLTGTSSADAVAVADGACSEAIEDSLCSAALSLLLGSAEDRYAGTGNPSARRKLCLRAESMIRDAHPAPLTVGELCRRLGTSERTLELGFREQYGVCPRRVLIAVRLQRARELLACADREVSVTQVATELGFWHFSRFSHYYRQMFGVPPSQTLREHKRGRVVRDTSANMWQHAIDGLAVRHSRDAA